MDIMYLYYSTGKKVEGPEEVEEVVKLNFCRKPFKNISEELRLRDMFPPIMSAPGGRFRVNV